MHFNRSFHYKPSIFRYPYFWKERIQTSKVTTSSSEINWGDQNIWVWKIQKFHWDMFYMRMILQEHLYIDMYMYIYINIYYTILHENQMLSFSSKGSLTSKKIPKRGTGDSSSLGLPLTSAAGQWKDSPIHHAIMPCHQIFLPQKWPWTGLSGKCPACIPRAKRNHSHNDTTPGERYNCWILRPKPLDGFHPQKDLPG